jgi:ATP/ADP translocase
MNRLLDWLDIRPGERKTLILAFCGAFLVVGMMILSRSVREGFYLARFDVKTLPYITAAVAFLALPAVGTFSKLLANFGASKVMKGLSVLLAAGFLLLWPVLKNSGAAVVAFYVWSAIGTLVLTSGFWILVSDHFEIRRAKRLFGLISAGGTLGALVLGSSIKSLTKKIDLTFLVPALTGLVLLFFLVLMLFPTSRPDATENSEAEEKSSALRNLGTIWKTEHLRWMGLIVMTATVASTLLDFQFKDFARASLTTKEALAGFFGGFYAWTALASLLLQVLFAAPLLSRFGLFAALSILPVILCFGSIGLFILPGLWTATLVRGGDNSLRKSLHRSALEVSYVPLPDELRRKTKAFIDSVLDAAAEGIGSGIIFLWVTWLALPSKGMAGIVAGLAIAFLVLNRKVSQSYFQTVEGQLKSDPHEVRHALLRSGVEGRDLLTATFSRLVLPRPAHPIRKEQMARASKALTPDKPSQSPSPQAEGEVPALVRLLARDSTLLEASDRLVSLGPDTIEQIKPIALSSDTDFVIRRRIPILLARFNDPRAEELLIELLFDRRFEVRYRCGIALMKMQRAFHREQSKNAVDQLWKAVEREVALERPVWELHQLLDADEADADEFVADRVAQRGQCGLEHTFRLLALILDGEAVRAAYSGVLVDDTKLKDCSLEYLELVLPVKVREKLWQFIGDLSQAQKEKKQRPLNAVVSDLLKSHMTLFGGEKGRLAVKQILEK